MRLLFIFTLLFTSLYSTPDEFNIDNYQNGERIFENKCSQCHKKYVEKKLLQKNFRNTQNKLLELKAPAGNQISYRLKHQLGDITDIDSHLFETTEFVREYLKNPDRSKSICLERVIKHFDTMKTMKGQISDEEIDMVTFFLYFLEGFEGVNEYYK